MKHISFTMETLTMFQKLSTMLHSTNTGALIESWKSTKETKYSIFCISSFVIVFVFHIGVNGYFNSGLFLQAVSLLEAFKPFPT